MRTRGEILGDGLEAVRAETVLTQSDLKLTLLVVEAVVDLRDQISTMVNVLISLRESIDKAH